MTSIITFDADALASLVADKVIARLKEEGGKVSAPPAAKPKGKATAKDAKPEEKPEVGTEEAQEQVLTMGIVMDKLRIHKEAHGTPATSKILMKYGKNVGAVDPLKYGAMVAELEGPELTSEADEQVSEEDDPFAI